MEIEAKDITTIPGKATVVVVVVERQRPCAMSFAQSVRWLEDWQLRLLVLASLFFQYFLFAAALLRKRRISWWFRSLIWLAYQGGDVVAIYALATLFSRHKKDELVMGRAHLDILWAPLLLLHLGGQDGITAYSIEDNENWRRHFLVAVSQITVAVYVFRKSWWINDRRLLRASILLFVPGIIKCLEKPFALKNATVASIMDSSDSRLEETLEEDYAVPKGIDSLERFVQVAANDVKELAEKNLELFEDDVSDGPYHLFVDLGHPYAVRLRNLRLMAPRPARKEVHSVLRTFLSKAFDRLYTKHKASFGGLLRAAVVLLTFADIGFFQRSHRVVYDRADVVVTYVLLCCTAALELVSASVVLGSGLPRPDDLVAQYNIVGHLAREKKRPWLSMLARLLGFKDPLDRLWCTAPPAPSRRITELVYDHVAGGWKLDITDVESYRRFNDCRGQRTLERARLFATAGGGGDTALAKSTRRPFDESVLIWHLATELCYFDHVDTGGDATRHSRVVSNYMAYLLFVKPEMLVPGARRGLFKAACRELRKMLRDRLPDDEMEPEPTEKKPPPTAMDEMARKIIQEVKTNIGSDELVHKAWALAHELMAFAQKKTEDFIEKEKKGKDEKKQPMEEENKAAEEEKKKAAAEEEKHLTEEKKKAEAKKREEEEKKHEELMNRAKKHGDEEMWAVIQGVWVEMLCFSAGRCRGYLHAKSLGKSGEYLSYVWLLLSYMGMETAPERAQRPELPVEGDTGALVKRPLDEELEEEMAPTRPRALVAPPPAASSSAVAPIVGDEHV